MNILIVDDEVLSVNGISNSLDWKALQIDNIYKAYSMNQAQEIFQNSKIDILLTDIEMPKGSGIDLVTWVQQNNYNPICIFLTSFSHFDYATSAIKLQVFDYVLKPCEYVELSKTIKKAVEKVLESSSKKDLAKHWDKNYTTIVTKFWSDILQGSISSDLSTLNLEIKKRHIKSSILDEKHYLMLIQVSPDKELQEWDESLWRFTISNVIFELLNCDIEIVSDKSFMYIVPEKNVQNIEDFSKLMNDGITTLKSIMPAEFFCFFAPPKNVEEINEIGKLLYSYSNSRYVVQSGVFQHGVQYTTAVLPNIPEEKWEHSLLTYNIELIIDDINELLTPNVDTQFISVDSLRVIYHKLLKVIYAVLDKTIDKENQPYFFDENIFTTVTDFIIWAENVTQTTVELISNKTQPSSVIDSLIEYIHDNLNNELNRTELTNIVHLHPDYLSTLFRQHTGVSLSEYITIERINLSKKLLLTTNQAISEIALNAGFQNISYFSKQFKKIEGLTPHQFRKQKIGY